MSNTDTMAPFPGYSTSSVGYLPCLVCVLFFVSRTREALALAHPNVRGPNESEEGGSSGRRDRAFGHSSKIDTRNNSPALNNFLEDVLNAQEEFKWIDHAVHRPNPRDVDSSFRRREESNEKSRRDFQTPRRVYLEDEVKAKRQINEDPSSASSLASLKRTILELSDSLNPRECEKPRNDFGNLESTRKLLWSQDIRSAIGVAIAYYDYEDGAEVGSPVVDLPVEQEAKREESSGPLAYASVKGQIPKKDENAEEERKEEREREKLNNKYPKEEFIGDMLERMGESKVAKKKPEVPPSSSNSLYSSMVLKRIPSGPESDESDSYSQCKVGSLRESDAEFGLGDENPFLDDENSFAEPHKTNVVQEEPDISVERTYLVISPGVEKRSRKRSVDLVDSRSIVTAKSSPLKTADKSARNYFALKITDDMFKGGVEQSNPLGEDKPIVERIESSRLSSSSASASSSSNGNSFVSLRSSKTTSPEWKVIEVIEEKMLEPENSMHSERRFGRRLTQIVTEEPPSHMNMSSTFLSPAVNNQLSNTTLILPDPSAATESFTNNDTTKNPEREFQQNNIREVTTTKMVEYTNFSKTLQSLPTTHDELHSTTLIFEDSSAISERYNNTRLRRHAGPFVHDDQSKRPRHRVHHEHAQAKNEDQKRPSVDAIESDAHHRKLTVLLAADNIEDESQIDLAVHGELAGKIVERIFEEVQRNEGLKVALGPGLYRKHKPQESMALDKMYRQGLDEDEVKETEAMMRRVMELLGRLVLDEVRRKTCASLAPDMRDFLQWSLGLEELAEPLSDQVPPLPLIPNNHQHDATEKTPPSSDKFLFQNSPDRDSLQSDDLTGLEKKVSLIKSLINEYRALTEREKTKVQTVHDYLVRQLALLMKYIESKEAANQGRVAEKSESAGARLPAGKQQILQYQGSMPNLAKNPRNIFNRTDIEANNSSTYSTISARPSPYSYLDDSSRGQRGFWAGQRHKKHGALELRRVRRERVNNHRENDATVESLEYRKLLRQIATLRRRKRENSWGYEKPKIYIGPLDSSLPSQLRVSLSTSADPEQPPPAAPLSLSNPPINSSTPVRGKNRLEDEVLLLNKREAWRKENERLLEEVAFGKDTRNDLMSGIENAEHLSNQDQELRMKRAFDVNTFSLSTTSSSSTLNTSDYKNELRSIEEKINVLPVEVQSRQKIEDSSETTVAKANL